MKVYITGSTGTLGYDVVRVAKELGHEVYAPTSQEVDITNFKQVRDSIIEFQPDAFIHCAAYTNVDMAEIEKARAWSINYDGTQNIAVVLSTLDKKCKMIYIGTEAAYDGIDQKNYPHKETDEVNPINFYARSKTEAEDIVKKFVPEHFIIRTNWVFGKNGNDFFRTMLKLKGDVTVVSDQVGLPAYSYDLAKLFFKMLDTEEYGIYNLTNSGNFKIKSALVREMFRQVGRTDNVNETTLQEWNDSHPVPEGKARARRNLNSALDLTKFETTFGKIPDWTDALSRYLKEIQNE